MSQPKKGPIWAKRVGDSAVASLNVTYCAGRDVKGRPAADNALVEYDLATNAAHALMLAETSIISQDEKRAILEALLAVRGMHQEGQAILTPEAEDIHMSIESLVTQMAGAGMGGRLHTGRSRNDQVATDMRMWLRDRVADLAREVSELARALARHAAEHASTPLPGITHMQPAMITTWGHWVTGYLARCERVMRLLRAIIADFQTCPLGAAASYGTSWPINRERTAELLGFDRPSESSVDVIWSRGEMESRFAYASAQLLAHLSGIGQDLILLSSPPRQWIRLPDAFVTGSSIMPQKRNPDFAEVTRAKAATVAGQLQALLSIGTAAANGYNRDTQWTKYLVMDVADEVAGAATLFAEAFTGIPGIGGGLEINRAAMLAACNEGFLNATDVADHLARTRNLPFRDCYRVLGAAVKNCEKHGRLTREAINAELASADIKAQPISAEEMDILNDPVRLVSLRNQTGSPHPDKVRQSIEKLMISINQSSQEIESTAHHWRSKLEDLWLMVENEG